ncbi:hypothetical protein QBC37DRAFT_399105 [Rhypophila decipiens]|uniref:Invertebrate defensins family profile domain-containing protein n=1 Tax=Rhypophila decipiens TaxID=261697 RepID=A0AAN7B905_9PEZI|nr:hypothetical protein QBC37DRAFT_399105 [Rhypophila decipiens]
MKTFSFTIILSLAASAVAVGETVYFLERNATCTDHDDGSITCKSGRLDGTPVIEARDIAPAIRGREPSNPLDRLVTCGLPFFGGTSCYLHCGLIGYCNHYCDDGICRCRCLDRSGAAGGLPCARTSCS